MKTDHLARLWAFVSHESPPHAFETWLSAHPDLENDLGPDLYFHLTACDYQCEWDLDRMRDYLRAHLPPRPTCDCAGLDDFLVVSNFRHTPFSLRFEAGLIRVAYFGRSRHWLSIEKCRTCGTHWLLGCDCTIYFQDLYQRVDPDVTRRARAGEWPARFFTLRNLLSHARDHGRPVAAPNPFGDGIPTMARELLNDTPDIPLEEAASLLGIQPASLVAMVPKRSFQGGILDFTARRHDRRGAAIPR